MMLLSKCAVCNSKKSTFVKELDTGGLLSSLGIRTPVCQIPFSGPLLFKKCKVNEIIEKFLLAGDRFMPKMWTIH